jgi:chemotaxis protein MotB
MKAKKPKHEEHENHERWLVSYADFITLLFAFFVVMYSISAVNEGKFRVAARSIQQALHPLIQWESSTRPFEISELQGSSRPGVGSTGAPQALGRPRALAQRLYAELAKFLPDGQLAVKPITVTTTDQGVLVTIMDQVLFDSGRADLRDEAYPLLQAMAAVLTDPTVHVEQIEIAGHTDNVPIQTPQFPSNWELSALRAVMVLRALAELYHVPAVWMQAVGVGAVKPVADNTTPEGRAQNRRVELLIRTGP